jgi:competence ComEA-like helix-hairpin-helix protein
LSSIAKGTALLAAAAVSFVTVRALVAALPDAAAPSPRPVCAEPVEIVEPAGLRVACAADLPACGQLPRGARVELGPPCRAHPEGMSGAARLLYGIPIDLNRATAVDLALLPGVGAKTAAAIVEDRETRGPFTSVAELERVRGIGAATLRELAPYLTTER